MNYFINVKVLTFVKWQFESGEEVKIEDVVAPHVEYLSLEMAKTSLLVTAKQFVQGGACRYGEVYESPLLF